MFLHMFGVAALGKPALALGIIASAYGAGNALATSEHRVPNPPAHEIATTTRSFEALLSECVARYKRGATNTREACDKAIAASGLTADAFAATYRSLLVPPAPKTENPAPTSTTRASTTTVPTIVSFEALLSECVARYRRGATTPKEACDSALAAVTLMAACSTGAAVIRLLGASQLVDDLDNARDVARDR